MPEFCRFMGLVFTMYPRDHGPPHLHVRYAEHQAQVLLNGTILRGSLPSKQQQLVAEWAKLRRGELEACWTAENRLFPLVNGPSGPFTAYRPAHRHQARARTLRCSPAPFHEPYTLQRSPRMNLSQASAALAPERLSTSAAGSPAVRTRRSCNHVGTERVTVALVRFTEAALEDLRDQWTHRPGLHPLPSGTVDCRP